MTATPIAIINAKGAVCFIDRRGRSKLPELSSAFWLSFSRFGPFSHVQADFPMSTSIDVSGYGVLGSSGSHPALTLSFFLSLRFKIYAHGQQEARKRAANTARIGKPVATHFYLFTQCIGRTACKIHIARISRSVRFFLSVIWLPSHNSLLIAGNQPPALKTFVLRWRLRTL